MIPKTPQSLPQKEMEKIKFVLREVVIEGATVYKKADFTPLYEKQINQEISLSAVYQIAAKITAKYRNAGYILSQAVIPPQTIGEGVVRIKVVEGFIDKVSIEGHPRGFSKILYQYTDKITHHPLRAKELERYLLLIDDLPGVRIKSVLTPSKQTPGAADLSLLMEQKAVDGYLSVDNRGSRFNGPFRSSAGVNFNSLFGRYDRTGLRFISALQTEELLYLNAFHEEQLDTEGTKLLLSGTFAKTEPGYSLKEFDVEGDSSSIYLMLTHPFIRSRGENLSVNLGFDHRNSRTDILDAKNSEDRLRVLSLGVYYDYADRFYGVNMFSLQLSRGLNILDATKSNSPDLSRENGHSDFTKLSGDAQRLQRLKPGWMALLATSWQYSFDNLLASEEFGVGGADYGRGYDASEITGDNGIAFKAEIQHALDINKKYFRGVQSYGFVDYGLVRQKHEPVGEKKQEYISSAGIGLRDNITESISGYVELDKPLTRSVAAQGNRDLRLFFSLALRF